MLGGNGRYRARFSPEFATARRSLGQIDVAETLAELRHDRPVRLGHLVEHGAETLGVEGEQLHRCQRPDGARPRTVVDQGHLPDRLTGTDAALALAADLEGRLAVHDDVALLARLALFGEDRAGLGLDLVHQL